MFIFVVGPKYWGKKYEGCSDSKRDQSPIDIPKASERKYDKYLKDMVFTNYDRNMTGRARNDGSRGEYSRVQSLYSASMAVPVSIVEYSPFIAF